jgi:predicted O-linked N-acetylglucosamine transferase (SPINDLY family)
MAASILSCLGLTDLIVQTPEAYRQKAVALASDGDRLADLHGSLRQRMQCSPLCDGASFTRGLEARLSWLMAALVRRGKGLVAASRSGTSLVAWHHNAG